MKIFNILWKAASKKKEDLKNILTNETLFHLKSIETNSYRAHIFPSVQDVFIKTDYTLGHKANDNQCQRTEIVDYSPWSYCN